MEKRSFGRYIKDNWALIPAWLVSGFIGIICLYDQVYGMAAFMFGVGVFALVAGYIDWKKRG